VSRFLLVKRDSRIAWGLLFLDGMPSLPAVIVFGFIGGIFPFWFLLLILLDVRSFAVIGLARWSSF